jgi:putative SOS response-associated peptidase YedK
MCGRFTYKLTWPQIVKLYRLSLDSPARNTQPRYNICPTTQIDAVIGREGARALVPMRWGLVPSWWSKPLNEMKLATFNARVETVTQKPMWHDAPDGKQPYFFTLSRLADESTHRLVSRRDAINSSSRDTYKDTKGRPRTDSS